MYPIQHEGKVYLEDGLTSPGPDTFVCHRCGKTVVVNKTDLCPNYAILRTGDGEDVRLCIWCASDLEREWMLSNGRTCLYLQEADGIPKEVTDWRGILRFKVMEYRFGRHNIAGSRTDVWFWGPDRHLWWGVLYGQNTQLIHCKRTKEKKDDRVHRE
ncbi:hypothetical protein LCGC14_0276010 [marine sediment metagenome]|uniref:Uncharacterized protein n=1 Tax=marine sediment metagenome TaxID=412755 RepID=A0A0F9U2M9_9ZZZZ